jgi:hypothetical protein
VECAVFSKGCKWCHGVVGDSSNANAENGLSGLSGLSGLRARRVIINALISGHSCQAFDCFLSKARPSFL